ncbi:MAG: hypothetical protein JNK04_08500 [Myxococcales bacterium]|nr:hypothetical protein [Myxococcales bacterium]
MRKNTLLGAAAFGLASVLNPGFFTGCHREAPRFSFGEADVVALVESSTTQRYELKTSEGTYEVAFSVTQAPGEDSTKSAGLTPAAVRVAHACGSRTFLRSAAACLELTAVPIGGTLEIRRIAPEPIALVDSVPAEGFLSVYGTDIDNAQIELKASAGGAEARLASDDGKTFFVRDITVAGKRLERTR